MIRARRVWLVFLGGAAVVALLAWSLLSTPRGVSLFGNYDEAARVRLCGVRTHPDGTRYCASEMAAKNPWALHRCPQDGSKALVHYDDDEQLDICCACGLVQPRNDAHYDMTPEQVRRRTKPLCWRPGEPCPADGLLSCSSPPASASGTALETQGVSPGFSREEACKCPPGDPLCDCL